MDKKCWNCKKKLQRRFSTSWLAREEKRLEEDSKKTYRSAVAIEQERRTNQQLHESHEAGGAYGDGFFCSLRCGYNFGVSAAEAIATGKLIRNGDADSGRV